jgi:hypothetical protein
LTQWDSNGQGTCAQPHACSSASRLASVGWSAGIDEFPTGLRRPAGAADNLDRKAELAAWFERHAARFEAGSAFIAGSTPGVSSQHHREDWGTVRPGRVAAIVALVGGLLWITAAALGWSADTKPVAHANPLVDAKTLAHATRFADAKTVTDTKPLVYDLGLVAFLLALAGFGYSLVDHAPWWLRLVVSLATPLLGLMGWITVVDLDTANAQIVLVAGIALLLGGLIAIARTRRLAVDDPPSRGHRGSHRLP